MPGPAPAATLGDLLNTPNGEVISAVAVTVFVEGVPAAMVGSICTDHAPYGPPHPPHVPNPVVSGSSTVFIEGRPAARAGDPFACGHIILTGSPTVIIGG